MRHFAKQSNKVAKMNSQDRIDMLVEALGKAALAMWNCESNMHNEAAEIESVLGFLSKTPAPAPIPDAVTVSSTGHSRLVSALQANSGSAKPDILGTLEELFNAERKHYKEMHDPLYAGEHMASYRDAMEKLRVFAAAPAPGDSQ